MLCKPSMLKSCAHVHARMHTRTHTHTAVLISQCFSLVLLPELSQSAIFVHAETAEVCQHFILEVFVSRVSGTPPFGQHEVPRPQEADATRLTRGLLHTGPLARDVVLVQVGRRLLGEAWRVVLVSRHRRRQLAVWDEHEHAARAVHVLVL